MDFHFPSEDIGLLHKQKIKINMVSESTQPKRIFFIHIFFEFALQIVFIFFKIGFASKLCISGNMGWSICAKSRCARIGFYSPPTLSVVYSKRTSDVLLWKLCPFLPFFSLCHCLLPRNFQKSSQSWWVLIQVSFCNFITWIQINFHFYDVVVLLIVWLLLFVVRMCVHVCQL